MLFSASVGFIIWAIVGLITLWNMGHYDEVDYSKVGLQFVLFVGGALAIHIVWDTLT